MKVKVIEEFTLKEFSKLKNIKRASHEKEGKLFKGDIFECDEEMAKYLLGDNPLGRPVVDLIEITPIIKTKEQVEKNIPIEKPLEKKAEIKKKKSKK